MKWNLYFMVVSHTEISFVLLKSYETWQYVSYVKIEVVSSKERELCISMNPFTLEASNAVWWSLVYEILEYHK